MDRIVKLSGFFLWSMVFIAATFYYTAINYSNNVKLEDLCNESEQRAHTMVDSELVQLLSDLNELRLTGKDNDPATGSDDLKWMDSCTGWVMVELRSRSFEKKLKKP